MFDFADAPRPYYKIGKFPVANTFNSMQKSQQSPITLLRGAPRSSAKTPEELPPGKLRMVITYLEMKIPQSYRYDPHRLENISIIRAHEPNAGFYRYLYNSVGGSWLWYERNLLSDEQLEEIIKHPEVRIYVLYVNGTPAGYSELDLRIENEVEIAYLGLLPEFIGRGLGAYFLRRTTDTAWSTNPERVWVHTCNFDSPNAARTYQKVGFSAYYQEEKIIDDPRIEAS